jgi:flagellar basal body P-ring protein FlgI
MRQRVLGRHWALGLGALALALVAAGTPKKSPPPTLKVEETISDLADIISYGDIQVEGIGLVAELDGTGSDPEPGYFREQLLKKMLKDGVYNAEKLLAGSKNFSLVLIRGRIPIGIGKQDTFDVDVELPPNSATSSLAGGQLFLTELRELRVAKGQALEGQVLASVYGPVMLGSAAKPDDPRCGRILGGARVKKDVPYKIVLKERRKSVATSKLVETRINQRFFEHGSGAIDKMANAQTDQYIELKVPHVYHLNQKRYFQVLGLLPVVEKADLRAERVARWGKELLDPKTAGTAALKLEGTGRNAVAILKTGLESPDPKVRFFAAESLAYLNDTSGVAVLGDAAVHLSDFRANALAALSAMDQAASSMKLRELVSQTDTSLKYGAFNALRALDPHDPFLGQIRVAIQPPDPEPRDDEEGASMAIRIRSSARRKGVKDPFDLFIVDCEGPPVIHVSRSHRCEIVLFGRKQSLLTPVVLGGDGAIMLNAALDDTKVQLSRIATGRPDLPDRRVESSLALGEVVREMSRMGASYPQILSILGAAAKQGNLPGPLVVDAVPVQLPSYSAAQLAGESDKDKKNGKKDDAVSKARFQTPSQPRRGIFNRLFGGGN